MSSLSNFYPRVDILGCPFDVISFNETEECIKQAVLKSSCVQLCPASIDFVIKARKNSGFRDALWGSDIVFADGVPILWAARILETPLKGRVSGTDIVYSCARISQELQIPVALVGGVWHNTLKAMANLHKHYPKSMLLSIEAPFPLDDKATATILSEIKRLKVKIILVALGAPKQELWLSRNLRRSGANVGIGIGSAFDIISGIMPRAPRIMRDYGFEWLYRMVLEPRRLGKRYLIENSPFFLYLLLTLIRKRH